MNYPNMPAVLSLVRKTNYPPTIRMRESDGRAYQSGVFYPDHFNVDGVDYELDEARVYYKNSHATYTRAIIGVKV